MARSYRRLVVRVDTGAEGEGEGRAVAELWSAGALGVETVAEEGGQVVLEAWFEIEPDGLPDAATFDFEVLDDGPVEARDWMALWRASVEPFEVGEHFLVDARDPEPLATPVPDGRIVLRCPGWSAFGTGSHESTRLVLRFLEHLEVRGRRVLDLGCGTGILSFAAAALGAGETVGCDIDAGSALIARQLSRLHRGAGPGGDRTSFFAGGLAALRPDSPGFDLALVNVLPERWLSEAGALVERLSPGAVVVVSGVLETEWPQVASRLGSVGLRPERAGATAPLMLAEGEWVAARLVLGSPGG